MGFLFVLVCLLRVSRQHAATSVLHQTMMDAFPMAQSFTFYADDAFGALQLNTAGKNNCYKITFVRKSETN